MDMPGLTKTQNKIMECLRDSIQMRGHVPTVREIAQEVGLKSTSSVQFQLSNLEKAGYIRRNPSKSRSIELTQDEFSVGRKEITNLPIIGEVAAGTPILAEQNITGYFPLPAESLPKGMGADEAFILTVHGDSMVNVGIMDKDQIFVRKTDSASNGDIVVALIDDSATVKTFFKEKGKIRLQPENDSYEPIIVDSCRILGRVFGVMRFL